MEVLIWGCHAFSEALFLNLRASNIKVVGFIAEDRRSDFCGLHVFSPDHIPNEQIPIIVATEHYLFLKRPILRLKNITEFKAKILEISNDYQIKNPLLHPAALVDFLDFNFKKVILFGMQGSGNVIFVNLLQSLYKLFFPFLVTRSSSTLFFEIMCREYMNLTQQVVSDLVHLQDGHDVRAVAWKMGTSHFNFKIAAQEAQLYSFATREHLFSFVSMYHQIPSLPYLQKLKRQKFKLFFVLRNPLDMILSGINKGGGILDDQIDLELFKCVSRWVIDQLNAWHPLMAELDILRYEDLIESPISTIKFLMKKIGILPLGFIAKKIWRKHAFKQLPHAFKQHFWKGGVGKWQQYFTEEHLRYLKAYGIERVLEKYEYLDALDKFKNLGDYQLEDYPRNYYRDEHYDTFKFLQQVNDPTHCYSNGQVHLVCKDQEVTEGLLKKMDTLYFKKIVRAGTL